jgi:hypothetical protein
LFYLFEIAYGRLNHKIKILFKGILNKVKSIFKKNIEFECYEYTCFTSKKSQLKIYDLNHILK